MIYICDGCGATIKAGDSNIGNWAKCGYQENNDIPFKSYFCPNCDPCNYGFPPKNHCKTVYFRGRTTMEYFGEGEDEKT